MQAAWSVTLLIMPQSTVERVTQQHVTHPRQKRACQLTAQQLTMTAVRAVQMCSPPLAVADVPVVQPLLCILLVLHSSRQAWGCW